MNIGWLLISCVDHFYSGKDAVQRELEFEEKKAVLTRKVKQIIFSQAKLISFCY